MLVLSFLPRTKRNNKRNFKKRRAKGSKRRRFEGGIILPGETFPTPSTSKHSFSDIAKSTSTAAGFCRQNWAFRGKKWPWEEEEELRSRTTSNHTLSRTSSPSSSTASTARRIGVRTDFLLLFIVSTDLLVVLVSLNELIQWRIVCFCFLCIFSVLSEFEIAVFFHGL